jgi:hypothetical protein
MISYHYLKKLLVTETFPNRVTEMLLHQLAATPVQPKPFSISVSPTCQSLKLHVPGVSRQKRSARVPPAATDDPTAAEK